MIESNLDSASGTKYLILEDNTKKDGRVTGFLSTRKGDAQPFSIETDNNGKIAFSTSYNDHKVYLQKCVIKKFANLNLISFTAKYASTTTSLQPSLDF